MIRSDSKEQTVNQIKANYIPSCFSFGEEYMFFTLRESNSETSQDLYRCRFGGSKLKKIISGYVESVQVVDDKLYYTNGKGHNKITKFCSSDLDGKNEEVIFEKEIYYPFITDGYLFYQDDKDGESLHMYNIEDKEDTKLTENHCWIYCIDGSDIYYCGYEKNKDYYADLIRRDINTGEETVLVENVYSSAIQVTDDSIYYINENDSSRLYSIDKNGENQKLISAEKDVFNCFLYDENLYYTTTIDGYLGKLYSCKLDGSKNKVIVDYTN